MPISDGIENPWWRCSALDEDDIDVRASDPKHAACEAVETWLSLDDDDDVDSTKFIVTVVMVTNDGKPLGIKSKWIVKARQRIRFETEAEEVKVNHNE